MTDNPQCEALLFKKTFNMPAERCMEDAVDGSDFCSEHLFMDEEYDGEPPDWVDDYELTEADREAFRALGLDEGTPF